MRNVDDYLQPYDSNKYNFHFEELKFRENIPFTKEPSPVFCFADAGVDMLKVPQHQREREGESAPPRWRDLCGFRAGVFWILVACRYDGSGIVFIFFYELSLW